MKDFFKIFNPEQAPSADELGVAYRRYWTQFTAAENLTRRILQEFGPDIINDAPQIPEPPKVVPEKVKIIGLMSQQEQAEAYERQQHQQNSRAAVEAAHQSMFMPKYGGQPIQRIQRDDSHEYGLKA